MMAIEQHPEQFHVGKGTSDETIRNDDLAGEARRGTDLARALIQHVCTMRADGYEDEIMVNGEVWGVEVKRKSPIS